MIHTATADELIQDIRSIGDKDSTLKSSVDTVFKRSIARHGKTHSTATVTMTTRIPRSDLCTRLEEVTQSLNLPYLYSHEFHGITPLHDAREGANVDVVAVPGLASHALGSWMSPISGNDQVWLRDFLPTDIPNIRVLAYGYKAPVVKTKLTQSIRTLSKTLLDKIMAFREEDGVWHP
ncbi:Ankyrin repeat-containing protein [Ilyonectria robusta]